MSTLGRALGLAISALLLTGIRGQVEGVKSSNIVLSVIPSCPWQGRCESTTQAPGITS